MSIEFSVFQAKRRSRQLMSGLVFIFILVGGWFWPLLGYFIPFCMVLGVGSGFFRGRKWCDWLCPRGSFYDAMISGASPRKEIPRVIKGNLFRIAAMALLMVLMAVNIITRWPDPYSIGRFFIIMLTSTTALGIILALVFHYRTWCQFCPIGTMISWVGKRKVPLAIDGQLCVECGSCAKVCPMCIKPYTFKLSSLVLDGDCLKCSSCVAVCPKKALAFKN